MNTRSIVGTTLTALLLLAPVDAGGQTPANTGASANVVAGRDTRWDVSTDGGTNWVLAYQVQNPPSVWEPATSDYSWIAATATASQGGGNYLFRTLFVLTPDQAAGASLSFRCAVDNYGSQAGFFSLNLGSFGGECGQQPAFDFGPTQTISSGFITGSNELRFHVTGDNTTDGLVVGKMTLEAVNAVPEPASVALLATGLVGLLGMGHLRRRTHSG